MDESLRLYRCTETQRDLDDANPYETALTALDGECRFFDLAAPGVNLSGCDLHQRLLAAYTKARP